ncbi:hypothetical protein [Rhodococcus rhodochrous]|uniref:Uncharacterized protein n=1 Tax=Rhodococcus rhodochrous TaxID=1829 RepID=A0AA46WWL2_RHORH|nr:hypothetical protein [Rhodococcus rhodochrous]UZF45735.1 hypothetical protein KUM34_003340 [Rhodococcus rhodochrous]
MQVPADPTLWRTAEISEPALLADPLITAGDVLRTGGPEAADHVLATIRQKVAALRAELGDPETVVDKHGGLPLSVATSP